MQSYNAPGMCRVAKTMDVFDFSARVGSCHPITKNRVKLFAISSTPRAWICSPYNCAAVSDAIAASRSRSREVYLVARGFKAQGARPADQA